MTAKGAIKGVLLDLGGVVYVGDAPLPGAIEAIARLRDAGIAYRFLTNSTRRPRRAIVAKLARLGLQVVSEHVFTPAFAARAILADEGLSPHLLIHPDLVEDFAGLDEGGGKALVVGDAGDAFDYAALNAAFRVLNEGAAFLALANNRHFRDSDGGLSLDAGPFVAALSFASGKQPRVLGKPAPGFFAAALADMGCAPHEAAMVGDDVENDAGGAKDSGLTGVLVKTGKYAEGDEDRIDSGPDIVAADLAEAVDRLLA